jgi:hypothetical protein
MTDDKKEVTPEELWAAAEAIALEAEARELAAESDEDIARELRADGIDPDRLVREGRELAARLLRNAAGAKNDPAAADDDRDRDAEHDVPHDDHVRGQDQDGIHPLAGAPLPPVQAQPAVILFPQRPRPRWPLLLVAAAIATLSITTVATLALRDRPLVPTPDDAAPRRAAPPEELAVKLRIEAESDCARRAWQTCLDKLDRARDLDPRGDLDPEVTSLRTGAASALSMPTPSPDEPDARGKADEKTKKAARDR